MREIQLRDAKATLSAVVNDAKARRAVHHHAAWSARSGGIELRGMAAGVQYTVVRKLLLASPLEDGDLPERTPMRETEF